MFAGVLVMNSTVNYWVLVFLVPLVVVIIWLRYLSLTTMRELKRIEAVSKYTLTLF